MGVGVRGLVSAGRRVVKQGLAGVEAHLSLPLVPWKQTPQDVQSVERISCVPGSRDLATRPIFSGHCGDMSEKNVSVSKTTHRAGIAQAALPAAAGPSYCHHVVQPLRMFHHPKRGCWLTDSGVPALLLDHSRLQLALLATSW
jgi:hypothetical protein